MIRLEGTMGTLRMLAISVAALATGCSDFHAQNQEGGETHFLSACTDGTACGDGLECLCGVCTATCGSRSECTEHDGATCVPLEGSSVACDGEPTAERVCDVRCVENSECSELGEGYECIAERCRPAEVVDQVADAAVECTEESCGKPTDPLVLFVIDTSGSMEREATCRCTSPSCDECLPKCAETGSEKNRWATVLEALTGTFEDFSCETLDRDSPDEPDRNYVIPYHKPSGTQRDDGVLQAFASRVRFGLATFDNVASYDRDDQRSPEEFSYAKSADIDGMWSYPPVTSESELEMRADGTTVGIYRYPGCPSPYMMNTGIQSRDAETGGLMIDMADGPRLAKVQSMRQSLLATRPFGGTPIAAALDDVRTLFQHDPWTQPLRDNSALGRHVILITDGRPDDDYRNVNCDCSERGTCAGLIGESEEGVRMNCPYPSPEMAARALVCGDDPACADRIVDTFDVVGFALEGDAKAMSAMDNMAYQAGSFARYASNADELRAALSSILQNIVGASSKPVDGDACIVDGLSYAHGAEWASSCGSCECQNGFVRCDPKLCAKCSRDWDCAANEVCRFDGVGCENGYCAPAASATSCDDPTNFDAVCGCDGQSYDSPCDAPNGIAHAGACEPAACTWLAASIEQGGSLPSFQLTENCTCIDGEFLCSHYTDGQSCSSLAPCPEGERCVLPVDQCAPSEDEGGYCIKVPRQCANDNAEAALCGCDGNLYTECELLMSGQNIADSSVCE